MPEDYSNSVRLFPGCSDSPYEYLVLYKPLSDEPGLHIADDWCFAERPLDYSICQVGHEVRVYKAINQTEYVWEVVAVDIYYPEKQDLSNLTGIIVCGCKLVREEPVQKKRKGIAQGIKKLRKIN